MQNADSAPEPGLQVRDAIAEIRCYSTLLARGTEIAEREFAATAHCWPRGTELAEWNLAAKKRPTLHPECAPSDERSRDEKGPRRARKDLRRTAELPRTGV